MSETKLSRAIQDALTLDPDVLVVRVHSGKVKVKGGWMQLAEEGTSDLLCCVKRVTTRTIRGTFSDGVLTYVEGRFCALEVKTPDGTTSKAREAKQGEFLERVRGLGGFGARVRSVDEALEAVKRCKSGESM